MNRITYFAVATLAMAAMYASTAGAVAVQCRTAADRVSFPNERYVEVDPALAGGFCDTYDGNLDSSGLLAGYTLIDKDVAADYTGTGGDPSEGWLQFTMNAGPSPHERTVGTWTIFSSALWNSFDQLFIAFHFGGGSGAPDSFIVELSRSDVTGSWQFFAPGTSGLNGLSNIYLLGKCPAGTPSCTPDRDVPEPGTLGLLGLGLAGLGFGMRRRRKI